MQKTSIYLLKFIIKKFFLEPESLSLLKNWNATFQRIGYLKEHFKIVFGSWREFYEWLMIN